MKYPWLLFVCCCSSILTVTGRIRVHKHSCLTAFWDSITCVFDILGNPEENSTYIVKFSYWKQHFSCPFITMNHSYSCVCRDPEVQILEETKFTIEICNDMGCDLVSKTFYPYLNIQLTAPYQAEVLETPQTVNISWTSGYENHTVFKDFLDYEILLQTFPRKENKIFHANSHMTSVSVPKSNLMPDTTYCVKVRSKPGHEEYSGNWSEWSPSTCWKNEAGEDQGGLSIILTKSVGPVIVAVGVLLFVLLYNTVPRMKITTLFHIPSPAPFFQPLFQNHEGNLKEWLSPQGSITMTYKTEEIKTSDAVIILPKPSTKEPTENLDFCNASVVTGLDFAQCHDSYVGLPGLHEASPPLPMVCPGNMSYTQFPCSVWGLGCGNEEEKEVVSPPPFLNISHADSGCGCEDLIQSTECCLTNNPVDENSPPCISKDYCILNKVADGFAPVLVSRGGSINVSSYALQDD